MIIYYKNATLFNISPPATQSKQLLQLPNRKLVNANFTVTQLLKLPHRKFVNANFTVTQLLQLPPRKSVNADFTVTQLLQLPHRKTCQFKCQCRTLCYSCPKEKACKCKFEHHTIVKVAPQKTCKHIFHFHTIVTVAPQKKPVIARFRVTQL